MYHAENRDSFKWKKLAGTGMTAPRENWSKVFDF